MRAWHARRKRSHESSTSCWTAWRMGVAAPARAAPQMGQTETRRLCGQKSDGAGTHIADKPATKRFFGARPACGGMLRVHLALAFALAFALAGCTSAVLNPASVAPAVTGLLPQADSLWPDHQNQPHPAFGWPTL